MSRRLQHSNGFTLVEIMVVLGVVGLVLALAAPAFQSSVQRSRFERATAELQSDLHLAIAAARSSGRAVVLDFDPTGYRVIDAADSARVYRDRQYEGGVRFEASGNPLVFPWGLVQPADVAVNTPRYGGDFRILPTGRLEREEDNQ